MSVIHVNKRIPWQTVHLICTVLYCTVLYHGLMVRGDHHDVKDFDEATPFPAGRMAGHIAVCVSAFI